MHSNPSKDPTTPAAKRGNGAAPRRRPWLPYVGAVALIAALVAGFWPKPAKVELSLVEIGVLRSTVNEEGRTRVRQRFTIASPVTGLLRRIPFKPGDEILSGKTVLAVIDPIQPAMLDARNRALTEARRDTASANADKARAAHQHASNELRRFEKLHAEKAISSQELETAQWREISAAKDQAAGESALRQVEAELAEFTPIDGGRTSPNGAPVELKSPVNGRVLRVFEQSSRVVASGTPLLDVGDASDLEVIIEVLSRDGAAILPGTKVELDQWGGGDLLTAKVRHVEPSAFTKVSALGVEEQRVNVIADLITPPEQRRSLGDHFRVEARIIVWETTQALKVSAGALFRQGQDWACFVFSNGRAKLRSVKAGRSSGAEMQVLDGLKEGEQVILYPGDRIRDGLRVQGIKI